MITALEFCKPLIKLNTAPKIRDVVDPSARLWPRFRSGEQFSDGEYELYTLKNGFTVAAWTNAHWPDAGVEEPALIFNAGLDWSGVRFMRFFEYIRTHYPELARHKIVAWDRSGIGRSPAADRLKSTKPMLASPAPGVLTAFPLPGSNIPTFSPQAHAMCQYLLAAKLGIEQFISVGHSYGGLVTLATQGHAQYFYGRSDVGRLVGAVYIDPSNLDLVNVPEQGNDVYVYWSPWRSHHPLDGTLRLTGGDIHDPNGIFYAADVEGAKLREGKYPPLPGVVISRHGDPVRTAHVRAPAHLDEPMAEGCRLLGQHLGDAVVEADSTHWVYEPEWTGDYRPTPDGKPGLVAGQISGVIDAARAGTPYVPDPTALAAHGATVWNLPELLEMTCGGTRLPPGPRTLRDVPTNEYALDLLGRVSQPGQGLLHLKPLEPYRPRPSTGASATENPQTGHRKPPHR